MRRNAKLPAATKVKFIQSEAATSGLGINQVEHFLKMSQVELELARMTSKAELSQLWIMPESPAKRDKIDSHERIVAYINKLTKRYR